jgi:hypothetical protein
VPHAVAEERYQRLPFDFPGHQADPACAAKILQEVQIDPSECRGATFLAESGKQAEAGRIFPVGPTFHVPPVRAIRLDCTLAGKEPLHRFGNYPLRRLGRCSQVGTVRFVGGLITLSVELPGQVRETTLSGLATSRLERLQDASRFVKTIDVEGALASVAHSRHTLWRDLKVGRMKRWGSQGTGGLRSSRASLPPGPKKGHAFRCRRNG